MPSRKPDAKLPREGMTLRLGRHIQMAWWLGLFPTKKNPRLEPDGQGGHLAPPNGRTGKLRERKARARKAGRRWPVSLEFRAGWRMNRNTQGWPDRSAEGFRGPPHPKCAAVMVGHSVRRAQGLGRSGSSSASRKRRVERSIKKKRRLPAANMLRQRESTPLSCLIGSGYVCQEP